VLVDSIRHPAWGLTSGAVWVSHDEPTLLPDITAATAVATVYVCITCRNRSDPDSDLRSGAMLAAATAAVGEGSGVTVQRVECLANCSRGPSAAMRCNGSWTYIFGELDITCAAALIDGARLLAQAANGILPWRGRPEPLKRGLIARVPPISFKQEAE
jgi:predicted metal-binding protein